MEKYKIVEYADSALLAVKRKTPSKRADWHPMRMRRGAGRLKMAAAASLAITLQAKHTNFLRIKF